MPIFDVAQAFTEAAAGMSVNDITPTARAAVCAAREMVEVNRSVKAWPATAMQGVIAAGSIGRC